MKKIYNLALLCAITAFAASCEEQAIPVYDVSDAAVMFASKSVVFSLKGVTDPQSELTIPLTMFGPICDYDRAVAVSVVDSTLNNASKDVDFTIDEALVPAGASKGKIVITVNALPSELEYRTVVLRIGDNEYFHRQGKGLQEAAVKWSKEYVRPALDLTWRSWYYFFCPGYSKALHELLYNEFGPEIEYASYVSSARNQPETYVYHPNSWWYTANRQFYDMVQSHDLANPDAPYMHSSDYEAYSSYTVAVGSGTKPDTPPTILSTLLSY